MAFRHQGGKELLPRAIVNKQKVGLAFGEDKVAMETVDNLIRSPVEQMIAYSF